MSESLWEALRPVAALMDGFGAPWGFAGGWALDLFMDRPTRAHADVDVAIFRDDQDRLRRALAGWTLRKASAGALHPLADDEWLAPPLHEIHAESPSGERLEFLLNDRIGEEWAFRRDPAVRCPAEQVFVRTDSGLPCLCPAAVLLYKAKAPRPIDQQDFERVAPLLPPTQGRWLASALARVHPNHPWLGALPRR